MIEIQNRQRKIRAFDTAALKRNAAVIDVAAGIVAHEVCVTLVSDERIHALNRDYRDKDRPTDVLSFAQNEGEFADMNAELLGDVIISVETAERQREVRGLTLVEEVTHLLIHGILHLRGYDHELDAEAEIMEAEERRIWGAIHGA